MPKKLSAKDVMKPHSEAKVRFYQSYLDKRLTILSQAKFTKEIHIYDLFCGRGVYADGKTGSAIRAYETIRQVLENRPSDKKIILHLNDKNKHFIDAVKDYIETHYDQDNPSCEVDYLNRNAIELLKELSIRSWKERSKDGVYNIFFIDPYGYKEIHREFLEHLLSTGSSEILLFLPISFMYRFTRHAFSNKVTQGALPLKRLISSYFPSTHPMCNGEEMNVQQYIDYLTEGFSCGGKFKITSYPIERNEKNQFALFFFSTNLYGFETVIKLKWQMIDDIGMGFHLPSLQTKLFDEFFRQETIKEAKELFRVKLTNFLMNHPRTNSELYQFTLSQGHLPQHAKDILRDWQNKQQLEIVDINTGEVISTKNKFLLKYGEHKKASLRFRLI